MPEDQFIAILQALKANDKTGRFCGRLTGVCICSCSKNVVNFHFAVCPRGHRYYIGNVRLQLLQYFVGARSREGVPCVWNIE